MSHLDEPDYGHSTYEGNEKREVEKAQYWRGLILKEKKTALESDWVKKLTARINFYILSFDVLL